MTEGSGRARLGRIRLGMVGGGEGAFIGAVHRFAARLDDRFDFVLSPTRPANKLDRFPPQKERVTRPHPECASA